MKNCYICKQIQSFEAFRKDRSQSSGFSSACKVCANVKRAEYAKKNKVYETSRRLAWAAANPEKQAAITQRYYGTPENYNKLLKKNRIWKTNNRQLTRKYNSQYRASKNKATVSWEKDLTEFVLREAYILAAMREELTGYEWHVDHTIPLRGEVVSGLHVWNNFQVISAKANRSKNNKYEVG